MAGDVEVNGTKISWAQVVAALMFTFWLGGLSIIVSSNADEIKTHEGKPTHEAAALATNTVQAAVKHNKETIEKVEKKLDELDKKIDENQKELLEAVRNQ